MAGSGSFVWGSYRSGYVRTVSGYKAPNKYDFVAVRTSRTWQTNEPVPC